MYNTNVLEVAKFFLEKERYMTHKKLQKLVYYAYAWFLVRNNSDSANLNNKLFDSTIEAWFHGPVCRDLYENYERMSRYISYGIKSEVEKFLEQIWRIYGKYTGAELENLTHKETPWKKAREGLSTNARSCVKIKDIDMYEYYYKKLNS